MRIVMRYDEGDGCTYNCENVFPIEYESPEAALVDFETALSSSAGTFSFANVGLHRENFFVYDGYSKPRRYVAPEFLTLDEWFGGNTNDSPKVWCAACENHVYENDVCYIKCGGKL